MEVEAGSASRTHGRTDSISEQVTDEDDDEPLDPRVQRELDQLNVSSAEINQLENELDEARTKYRSTVSEMSSRMEAIGQDQKRCIRKSREYYKLIHEAKMAQNEALKAARMYQTATGVYTAARETLTLAERSLLEEADTAPAAQLTSAWQEMLSNAVTKLTEAEKEKSLCETEHKRRASRFAELEVRKQMIEKKQARAIKKAKPYFDLKTQLDIKLMQQKQNVTDLQAAIKANKVKYKAALRRLERISEEIHQSRNDKMWSQVPRMPGVGAETASISSGLSELALDAYFKEETDSTSVDGESIKEFTDSIEMEVTDKIEVVVGADDDPSDRQPEKEFTDNIEKKFTDSIDDHPVGRQAKSVELVTDDTGKCNTDPDTDVGTTGNTSPDSEEEVFEDAETGTDDADVTENDKFNSAKDIPSDDKVKSCDEFEREADNIEINKNVNENETRDNSLGKTESGQSESNNADTNKDATDRESSVTSSGPASEMGAVEDVEYTDVNIRNIERPSLSGEEE